MVERDLCAQRFLESQAITFQTASGYRDHPPGAGEGLRCPKQSGIAQPPDFFIPNHDKLLPGGTCYVMLVFLPQKMLIDYAAEMAVQ